MSSHDTLWRLFSLNLHKHFPCHLFIFFCRQTRFSFSQTSLTCHQVVWHLLSFKTLNKSLLSHITFLLFLGQFDFQVKFFNLTLNPTFLDNMEQLLLFVWKGFWLRLSSERKLFTSLNQDITFLKDYNTRYSTYNFIVILFNFF